jgi:hypothetical protein
MRLTAPRSTRRLLTLPLLAGLIAVGGLPGTARAASTDGPDFEMPFPCGDTWTGSSRASHSPSALSIDWNRADDLGAPMMAAAPGVVSKVADLGSRSYGRYVVVDHGGGRSTVYAHLQSIWTSQGQAVDQGTLIGQVGSTGGSTGPHLHFEERRDGTVQRSYFHRSLFTMGRTLSSQMCSDTPVMGDWDGNGTSNIGLLRRTASPQFLGKRAGMPKRVIGYGRGGDQPLAGDWDGDGTWEVGVRRPSTHAFLLRNANGSTTSVQLGGTVYATGITGDWDGDGRSEVGLWNPSTRQFTQRLRTGTLRRFTLGSLGDLPVAADWNGDRRTDVGVFTPSTGTFTLRSVSRAGAVSLSRVGLGGSRSLPVAGDWNDDGRGDVGVYDPGTAGFSLRLTPSAGSRTAYRNSVWGEPRG